jgi:hypothetical protein
MDFKQFFHLPMSNVYVRDWLKITFVGFYFKNIFFVETLESQCVQKYLVKWWYEKYIIDIKVIGAMFMSKYDKVEVHSLDNCPKHNWKVYLATFLTQKLALFHFFPILFLYKILLQGFETWSHDYKTYFVFSIQLPKVVYSRNIFEWILYFYSSNIIFDTIQKSYMITLKL